jgi:hypothetical protein
MPSAVEADFTQHPTGEQLQLSLSREARLQQRCVAHPHMLEQDRAGNRNLPRDRLNCRNTEASAEDWQRSSRLTQSQRRHPTRSTQFVCLFVCVFAAG